MAVQSIAPPVSHADDATLYAMFGEDPPEDRPGLGADIGFFQEAMEIFKDLEATEPAAVKDFLAAHGLDELCELQDQENGTVVIWPSRLLLEFLARMGKDLRED